MTEELTAVVSGVGIVWFGVLGSFVVRNGADDRTPHALKVRTLLALLVVRAGEVVPTAQLIAELWNGEPPPTAATALQVYISKARSALAGVDGRRGPTELLRTASGGYVLQIDADDCDVLQFEALADKGNVELAHGDPSAASTTLASALSLW
ncbi:MAG: AfsR/SARP family transcriptional regulator, partial [Sciscionella sp.]